MASHIDGNVLAGVLSEVFAADATTALGRCANCGDESDLAEAMVYVKPKTYIARCHKCDGMLLTIIQSSRGTRLDLSGLAGLTFAS